MTNLNNNQVQLEDQELDAIVGGSSQENMDTFLAQLEAEEEYEKKTGGGIISVPSMTEQEGGIFS